MKPFRCNYCEPEALFDSTKEMIAHYRKQHPDGGYNLWDAIADVGDKFANAAIAAAHERVLRAQKKNEEYYAKAKDYDALAARYSRMARALAVIDLTLQNAKHDAK